MNIPSYGPRVAVMLVTTLTTLVPITPARATVFTIDASAPPPQNRTRIVMGAAKSPAGTELTVDGVSVRENDRPWVPVMGEFHYSRYPQNEWRDELLKMKAGGVDVVSCYVFWIHHEEVENQWDWTDRRDLRAFVRLCGELGLRVIVRCGPWDHGEVRNGGFPEWLLDKHYKLRSDDAGYLAEVQKLYGEIAAQLKGQLWKDGGPVIGIQLENEYWGDPQHLLTLKRLAVEAGLDVPIYTRTGWPELPKPLPFGELLPLFGGYAEGFWDRKLEAMPGKYWTEFAFKYERTDAQIANDHFGARPARDEAGAQSYPYLTCELGAGMMTSYHRRVQAFPMDALAVAMVRLGSGSTSPGYYMYHGGTNPDSKTGITLQESQATRNTNYNDLPVKSYDFQTALGEFGQVRPQYHLLRRLHLFLHDFGQSLAEMPAFIPEAKPSGKTDADTLRWSVRSDSGRAFLFVNNYQRLQPMPAKAGVQFRVALTDGDVTVPREPVTIPAESTFLWPINLDLGGAGRGGARLVYATAQPICFADEGDARVTVFVATGATTEFAFDASSVADVSSSFDVRRGDGIVTIRNIKPGTSAAIQLRATDGTRHTIVVLDDAMSLTCWKARWSARDRVFLSNASLVVDGEKLRLTSTENDPMSVAMWPAPKSLSLGGRAMEATPDGIFGRFNLPTAQVDEPRRATVKRVKPPGNARPVPIGKQKVAQAPDDAEFAEAGVWHVTPPVNIGHERRLLLRVHYAGDVARAYVGDRLVTDNFYNGTAFDIGVNRFAPEIYEHGLTIKVLPLRKDAPIHLLERSWPQFDDHDSIAEVRGVDVTEERTVELEADDGRQEPRGTKE